MSYAKLICDRLEVDIENFFELGDWISQLRFIHGQDVEFEIIPVSDIARNHEKVGKWKHLGGNSNLQGDLE